jgi:hypothetical protein
MTTDPPNGAATNHAQHVDCSNRRGDRVALFSDIPDFDIAELGHVRSLAETDMKPGNRHATDTKSGNRHRNAEPTPSESLTANTPQEQPIPHRG